MIPKSVPPFVTALLHLCIASCTDVLLHDAHCLVVCWFLYVSNYVWLCMDTICNTLHCLYKAAFELFWSNRGSTREPCSPRNWWPHQDWESLKRSLQSDGHSLHVCCISTQPSKHIKTTYENEMHMYLDYFARAPTIRSSVSFQYPLSIHVFSHLVVPSLFRPLFYWNWIHPGMRTKCRLFAFRHHVVFRSFDSRGSSYVDRGQLQLHG